MGKATKWLKGLLGMKKEKETRTSRNANENESREKRRWSFARLGKDSSSVSQLGQIPGGGRDAPWLSNYMLDTEKDQKKHAIAVAAATAAAADAAVAAAQAAVAVVRLTNQGRGGCGGWRREQGAAVKIQTVFRGYLARKALRALKGLVKLQAHVRGYLVRKRASATLRGMQALIRAQAGVRSQRSRRSFTKEMPRLHLEIRPRRSTERSDEPRSELFHSKRLSASYDPCCHSTNNSNINAYDYDSNSPKIVEIDTFKPKSKSRRSSIASCNYHYPASSVSDYSVGDDLLHYPTMSSPLPCPVPARLYIPDCRYHVCAAPKRYRDWGFCGEDHQFRISSTAHSTPRFAHSICVNGGGPPTPAKSVCGDGHFSRPYCCYNNKNGSSVEGNCPNYMANTQSFRAKLRSQSAPRQRMEASPSSGSKKKLSLNEVMASRNSISSVRMQRSRPLFQEALEV